MRQIKRTIGDSEAEKAEVFAFARLDTADTFSMMERAEAIRWARDNGFTDNQLIWLERGLKKTQRGRTIAEHGLDPTGMILSENETVGNPSPFLWKRPRRVQKYEVIEGG